MEEIISDDTYELVFRFDAEDVAIEDGKEWLNKILDALPVGATGTIKREPLVLDINEVGPQHEGYDIVIKRGDASKDIRGKLSAVYPAAAQFDRVFVVDGRAIPVHAYEIATLS